MSEQVTLPAPGPVARLSYTHEAMMDLLIAQPSMNIKEVAAIFGYTPTWVGRLLRSDAFREMLTAKKNAIMDPVLLQGIETRLQVIAGRAIDVLEEKLDAAPSADVALKTLEIAQRGLGMGVAKGAAVQVNNFVVAMPQKEANGAAWIQAHSPRPPVTIDAPSGGSQGDAS